MIVRMGGWDYSCRRVRNPNRGATALLLRLGIVIVVMSGCGPTAQPRSQRDSWFDDDAPSDISPNLDTAEERWRREIENERGTDPLLTDDPPGAPEDYGKVTSEDGYDLLGDQPVPPTTFWGKVKVGANTVGKASFAAVSVLVALGMMVAPYLLL